MRLRWLLLLLFVLSATAGADWPRFRGPSGAAAAPEADVPMQWSVDENLLWQAELPGRGASSPIVRGDRVFLTAFSGYGMSEEQPGERESLKLHVLCLDRRTGQLLWDRSFAASENEQAFGRRIPIHGYATNTPAADEDTVYAYFGVSGLYAYDFAGNRKWHAQTGDRTVGFGTSASPIVHNNLVIINASIETQAVIAFDRESGKEQWRIADVVKSWTTPLVANTADGQPELVVSYQNSVGGFDPASGKPLWTCQGIQDYVVPSVVASDGIVYCLGGRKNQSMAIRLGGRGDVSESHLLWSTNIGANVTSPVLYEGRLHWVSDRGVACCLDAATGKELYRERIGARERVYASALLAGGRLYVATRDRGVIVLAAGADYKVLASNVLTSDDVFNASPAISGNQLLLRTDRTLYCIGK